MSTFNGSRETCATKASLYNRSWDPWLILHFGERRYGGPEGLAAYLAEGPCALHFAACRAPGGSDVAVRGDDRAGDHHDVEVIDDTRRARAAVDGYAAWYAPTVLSGPFDQWAEATMAGQLDAWLNSTRTE